MTPQRPPFIPAALAVSLLLNGMWLLSMTRDGSGSSSGHVIAADLKPQTENGNTATASRSTGEPAAFQWQQLDSPDFATYVANLRNIGCPEATIRDIIDGELREIYAHQTDDGDGVDRAVSAGVSWTPDKEAERLGILSTLLSHASASERHATAANAVRRVVEDASGVETPQSVTGGSPDTSQPASFSHAFDPVPAAFRVGNQDESGAPVDELVVEVTDRNMDPETAGQISLMRQDFAQALREGATTSDPTSQGYFKQWMKAKRDSDDRFSSMYGGDAMDALYRKSMLDAGNAPAQTPVR